MGLVIKIFEIVLNSSTKKLKGSDAKYELLPINAPQLVMRLTVWTLYVTTTYFIVKNIKIYQNGL